MPRASDRADRSRRAPHPRRLQILERIAQEPGLPISSLARALGFNRTITLHHVRALERTRQARVHRFGRRTAVFLVGGTRGGREEALSLLRRSTPARVWDAVVRRPGLRQRHLVAQLGLTQQHLSATLAALAAAGLVECRRTSGRRAYFPVEPRAASPHKAETERPSAARRTVGP